MILVFGASGFSGSNFIKYIINNCDDQVIGVTRNGGGEFESADIAIYSDVETVILKSKPDYIVNFAGSFSGDFDVDYKVNVLGSKNILDAVQNNELSKIKILLIGSSGEYGVNETMPISEEHPLSPSSFYALTKVFQAELMAYYFNIYQLNVCLVRTSNLIGPYMPDKLFIGNFFRQVYKFSENSKIIVGREHAFRDYIDIRDAVRAYYGVLKRGLSGESYNIGSGSATQIKTIIDITLDRVGIKRDKVMNRNSDSVNQVDYQLLDISKINKLLGFLPKYTIEESVNYVMTEMQK